jgi:hypothetical protein
MTVLSRRIAFCIVRKMNRAFVRVSSRYWRMKDDSGATFDTIITSAGIDPDIIPITVDNEKSRAVIKTSTTWN